MSQEQIKTYCITLSIITGLPVIKILCGKYDWRLYVFYWSLAFLMPFTGFVCTFLGITEIISYQPKKIYKAEAMSINKIVYFSNINCFII